MQDNHNRGNWKEMSYKKLSALSEKFFYKTILALK